MKLGGPSEQQVDDRLVKTMAVTRLIEMVWAKVAVELGARRPHAVAFQGAQQPEVEQVAPVAARAVDQLNACADHPHLLQLVDREGKIF